MQPSEHNHTLSEAQVCFEACKRSCAPSRRVCRPLLEYVAKLPSGIHLGCHGWCSDRTFKPNTRSAPCAPVLDWHSSVHDCINPVLGGYCIGSHIRTSGWITATYIPIHLSYQTTPDTLPPPPAAQGHDDLPGAAAHRHAAQAAHGGHLLAARGRRAPGLLGAVGGRPARARRLRALHQERHPVRAPHCVLDVALRSCLSAEVPGPGRWHRVKAVSGCGLCNPMPSCDKRQRRLKAMHSNAVSLRCL